MNKDEIVYVERCWCGAPLREDGACSEWGPIADEAMRRLALHIDDPIDL